MPPPPAARSALWVLAVLLAVLWSYELLQVWRLYSPTVLTGDHAGRMTTFGDLDYYTEAARRFLRDPASLYDRPSMLAFVGYIYPPVGILFFVPVALLGPTAGFLAFIAVSVCSGIAAAALLGGMVLRGGRLVLFILLVAASGPFFANLVNVQFNLLVLLASAVAIAAGARNQVWLAALALALACWMKIYPGVLLIAMLGLPAYRPVAVRALLVGLVLPVLLLWWLPPSVYLDFLAAARALSGQFLSHLDNGSLVAALHRLRLPPDQWPLYRIMPIDPALGLASLAMGALLVALLLWRGMQRRGTAAHDRRVLLTALAVIPLLTPQGWGHAFIFAIPLLADLILVERRVAVRLLAACGWLALLAPGYHVFGVLDHAPLAVAALVYSRDTVAVLALILLALLLPEASWSRRHA